MELKTNEDKVSIIVMTHNALQSLKVCLRELNYSMLDSKVDWELIIVDNKGTPEIKKFLDYKIKTPLGQKMTVIHTNKNLDFSRANNREMKSSYHGNPFMS